MPEAPSERARVHRLPERAAYDRDTIEGILDEALICHVAWTDADGRARALPTIHARVGDTLYLHGSRPARRRARPRAERLPSLDELPKRGALRTRPRGDRRR